MKLLKMQKNKKTIVHPTMRSHCVCLSSTFTQQHLPIWLTCLPCCGRRQWASQCRRRPSRLLCSPCSLWWPHAARSRLQWLCRLTWSSPPGCCCWCFLHLRCWCCCCCCLQVDDAPSPSWRICLVEGDGQGEKGLIGGCRKAFGGWKENKNMI